MASRRRWYLMIAALALLALVTAGCGRPTAGPAPAGCVTARDISGPPSGYLTSELNVQSGICEAFVAMEGFGLNFTLPAPVDEAVARKALHIEGGRPPERVDIGGPNIYVTFPAGANDEETIVRLAGPLGLNGATVDMGFRVRRRPSPTITPEIKLGGAWQPVTPGVTLPAGPLTFRFRLTGHRRQLPHSRPAGLGGGGPADSHAARAAAPGSDLHQPHTRGFRHQQPGGQLLPLHRRATETGRR
ncbi:MAG TPA: hypothetical protein VGK74_17185 [Symbiobacteriaceae bacterium]|jgi:hypothetical protein